MGCFQLQGALANVERLQPLAGQGQELIAAEPLALQTIVINYQMRVGAMREVLNPQTCSSSTSMANEVCCIE